MGRVCDILKWFAKAFHRPTLTNHLPPIPLRSYTETASTSASTPTPEERAESMLLEIMRAPPEYVNAAILVAQATKSLRRGGDDVYAEGFVVFTLSRMLHDADGTISMKRLREQIRDAPPSRGLISTMLRLEEQGVLIFEAETAGHAAAASRFMRMDDVRIRLLELP